MATASNEVNVFSLCGNHVASFQTLLPLEVQRMLGKRKYAILNIPSEIAVAIVCLQRPLRRCPDLRRIDQRAFAPRGSARSRA